MIFGRADGQTFRRKILAAAILLSVSATVRLSALQCPDGSPPPCRAAPTDPGRKPGVPPNSVAVLYFDNLSRDTADAYLADGITEEMIVRLGRIERLAVKSRNAVQRFRGRAAQDPAALGRSLGVAHLVSGSVRREGARLRVTVELVRTATGLRVWGDALYRNSADLLSIEEDIAREVATAIAGRLLPAERSSLSERPTRNPEAYDHFVRGNYHVAQRTARAVGRAIEEYRAAVALDPGFTRALARIAYAYALVLDWEWHVPGSPPESLLARGFVAVDDALRRDSTASDAWMARAYLLKRRYPQNYVGVREAFERAIALDTRNAEALHQYGSAIRELGDDSGAVEADHRALALEAERPITLFELAQNSLIRKRYAESAQWLDSALAIDPGFFIARSLRAVVRARLGDRAGALADIGTALEVGGEDRLIAYGFEAVMHGLLGDSLGARAGAQRLLCELDNPDHPTPFKGFLASSALIAAGEREQGLDVLERVRPRGLYLLWLLRWPEFDSVRANPRFQRMVEEARPR